MNRRDRQGARTPADLERRYNFEKRFDDAMETAEAANEAVKNLDGMLDQTEVFNRLTNSGKSQGFFIGDDGQVYINASYLVTGVLKSKDGHTFYLDLEKGILRGQFSEFSIAGKTVDKIAKDRADQAEKNAQSYTKNYADASSQAAVAAQTQTDIFNKLTNNGSAQGIYYQDGELYINASYLVMGILQSVDQSTFYLDLANNVFKIAGKTVSWKDNGDGTFTLVGT